MKILRPLLLGLAFALGALPNLAAANESALNCYGDLCVGDRAIDLVHANREVSILAVDYRGWFVTRFFDTGEIVSDVARPALAATVGCTLDLCVGFPVLSGEWNFDAARIEGLQLDGSFVVRSLATNQLFANVDRESLAPVWGCVSGFCVNDTVYNRTNNRVSVVVAVQSHRGFPDLIVLSSPGQPTVGNWDPSELILMGHGPVAQPPQVPCGRTTHWDPRTNRCAIDQPPPPPTCPWGTHWDPRTNRCVNDLPPPPPSCPWGTHWDPRQNRCVNDLPPPPPTCPRGTHWDPRQNRCVNDLPPPPPPPTCPSGTHWDPRTNRCVSNHPNPNPVPPPTPPNPRPDPTPPETCPPGRHWDPRQNRCV